MRSPRPPAGSPQGYSTADLNRVVERLQGAVELEQEITLSPWQAWLVLRIIVTLQYRARKG